MHGQGSSEDTGAHTHPTCQPLLQAAHALCEAQGQHLQPGSCLGAWHLGQVKSQRRGRSREGEGCAVLLQAQGDGLLLAGGPGERPRCWCRPPRPRPPPPRARAHLNRAARSLSAPRPQGAFCGHRASSPAAWDPRLTGITPNSRAPGPRYAPARPRCPARGGRSRAPRRPSRWGEGASARPPGGAPAYAGPRSLTRGGSRHDPPPRCPPARRSTRSGADPGRAVTCRAAATTTAAEP